MKSQLQDIAKQIPESVVLNSQPFPRLLIPFSIYIPASMLVRLPIKHQISPFSGDFVLALLGTDGNLVFVEKNAKESVPSKKFPEGSWFWVFEPKVEELISVM
mmetsp:Transcript_8228/g.11329  ORF Transcript_8228/g.11329 Transcript_8228/m.11329 type:complete len:103 (-) Transcript_8228:12-320(-)